MVVLPQSYNLSPAHAVVAVAVASVEVVVAAVAVAAVDADAAVATLELFVEALPLDVADSFSAVDHAVATRLEVFEQKLSG